MRKKIIAFDTAQARALFLKKQLLARSRPESGKIGTFNVIDALGYVQIDTINVIDRSHHIVLFNRCPDYRHSFLDELLARDTLIFEYWAHMASYIPMKDYRYYIRRMKEPPQKGSWLYTWLKSNRQLMKKVKTKIKNEGALSAGDFADVKGRKRGSWWDWKPAKAALEVLFLRGELMIRERRNFQRVYDLTERVLPDSISTALPLKNEENRFFIKRALNALGVASIQDMQNYIRIHESLAPLIEDMVASGELYAVSIKGISKTYYVSDIELLKNMRMRHSNRVLFLSPFDNAIILRNRTKALFDFDYALECYKPKAQRVYGYFCLPVLWRNEFVGRIDLKADRKTGTLIIRNLHIEKENIILDDFLYNFIETLKDFTRFHNAGSIMCEHVSPAKYKNTIRKRLKK